MHNKNTVQQTLKNSDALSHLIVNCIQDIKGKKIMKLDLRAIDDAPTDIFIICEGDSTTQISAIANNIQKRVKEGTGKNPSSIEGLPSSKWILVDYFDIVVHIFYPETREFYEIEDLWSDAIVTEYQNL